MKEIIEKISSYNIFTNLLPGVIFTILIKEITGVNFAQSDVFETLFVYYFIGLILSRIGSIIIEPIFKRLKLVRYVEYSKFIYASSKDIKIDILLEANNTYRTFVSVFIVSLFIAIGKVSGIQLNMKIDVLKFIALFVLIVLFILSYSKNTKYIRSRIDKHIAKDK